MANPEAVAAWEAFFNANDPRAGLVSRYIFQHVFLATIVLTDSPGDQFRLVRSSTPPSHMVEDANGDKRVESSPVKVIGTGLPYDDPYRYAGVDKFWYRLEKRAEPLAEMVALIAKRLGPAISGLPDPLNPQVKPNVKLTAPMRGFDDFERTISTLTAVDDRRFPRFLPSVTVLRLNHKGERRVYSLVANHVYASQYTLLFQNGQARPKEDTMSVYPTLVNGFPNLFVDIDLAQAPGFLGDLAAVKTEEDWRRLESRYGILRNSERFWPFYDWLNAWNFSERGDDAGWLDLIYYDAPER